MLYQYGNICASTHFCENSGLLVNPRTVSPLVLKLASSTPSTHVRSCHNCADISHKAEKGRISQARYDLQVFFLHHDDWSRSYAPSQLRKIRSVRLRFLCSDRSLYCRYPSSQKARKVRPHRFPSYISIPRDTEASADRN